MNAWLPKPISQGIDEIILFMKFIYFMISVADPGCLSRIPDTSFFHPESQIPDPGSASKNLSILTPKSGF
jgi:hypothetical protein